MIIVYLGSGIGHFTHNLLKRGRLFHLFLVVQSDFLAELSRVRRHPDSLMLLLVVLYERRCVFLCKFGAEIGIQKMLNFDLISNTLSHLLFFKTLSRTLCCIYLLFITNLAQPPLPASSRSIHNCDTGWRVAFSRQKSHSLSSRGHKGGNTLKILFSRYPPPPLNNNITIIFIHNRIFLVVASGHAIFSRRLPSLSCPIYIYIYVLCAPHYSSWALGRLSSGCLSTIVRLRSPQLNSRKTHSGAHFSTSLCCCCCCGCFPGSVLLSPRNSLAAASADRWSNYVKHKLHSCSTRYWAEEWAAVAERAPRCIL